MSTLHIVGLPHTQTTHEFGHCAYTSKVRKACGMMKNEGWNVILYAGDENDADCHELVTIAPKREQEDWFAEEKWWREGNITAVNWDHSKTGWTKFNQRAIEQIARRLHPDDWIWLITGIPHTPIINAFDNQCVEFGVGYSGISARFQIYESYAWMHMVYGARTEPMSADGKPTDCVIPNFYDIDEFPAASHSNGGPYYVYMSRMVDRKGWATAFDVTERLGVKLKVAGLPDPNRTLPPHVEHVGLVNAQERGDLLANAAATLMPTVYVEPFGGVAAESLLCGTPVISTDWGAFPELIEQGHDGYRCRTQHEWDRALFLAPNLNRDKIRARAQARFSTSRVGPQYTAHMHRLEELTRT